MLAMPHALWVSVQPQRLKDSWLLLVFLSLTHTVQLKQLLVDSANVPRVGQPLKQVLASQLVGCTGVSAILRRFENTLIKHAACILLTL